MFPRRSPELDSPPLLVALAPENDDAVGGAPGSEFDLPPLDLPPLPLPRDVEEDEEQGEPPDATRLGLTDVERALDEAEEAFGETTDGGDTETPAGEDEETEGDDDERDTAHLVVKHLPEIVSFCYSRTGDWAMAEEAAQETMVNVIRGESRCPFDDGPNEVRGWILELARAVCVDVLRRRAVASLEAVDPRDRLERRSRDRSGIDPSQRRGVDHRSSDERSARLVAGVTEPGRSIVKMRLWDHRSFDEIGEALGKTTEAVALLYGEALVDLEAAIAGEEGNARGGAR
jgi:RNA polymerase sigma factor (sigma-70 family)